MATGIGDTIVALSSGAVPSGVAIVRLSGPGAGQVMTSMLDRPAEPRRLILSPIRIGGVILDTGLLAWMPGPHSFTGEDCLELHLHGSPAVVRGVLRALTAVSGFRLAGAGEFTRRAFENGKLDLVEAQGLGDLIEAETENQRALAYARMEGGLTRRLDGWRERLLGLRALVEAQLDFSDEGDVGELPTAFLEGVKALARDIGSVIAQRGQGRIIRSGFRVVLAGPPNAGKSSLLNALSQSDVAIVSDEPGTTRDLKEVPLDVRGQLIMLIDSAGLRETDSRAEAIGIDRARQAILSADQVLWLSAPDIQDELPPTFPEFDDEPWRVPAIARIGTKSDIGPVAGVDLSVSATTGAGIADLLDKLYDATGAARVQPGSILVSHEHDRAALLEAYMELDDVASVVAQPELAAEKLRRASAALERLLGRMDAELVLDHLFSRFCIGK